MPTFQRARSREAKQERIDAILKAAYALGAKQGIGRVSLTDIANEVGMHKSALLRYFETREQIYLILAAMAWREWATDVIARLAADAQSPAKAAAALATSLGERPIFCDLVAHCAISLERHVSLEAICEFKEAALESTYAVAAQLQARLSITERQAVDVIATATSMAGMFYQFATPAPDVLRMYQNHPRLRHVVGDIAPRLRAILEGLLCGFERMNDRGDPGHVAD
ncbi:TetR family transcriptional regulator [Pandoraea fibrosis]|nr:TetR family transcriptional regulator [Pandoraea fibrosis]